MCGMLDPEKKDKRGIQDIEDPPEEALYQRILGMNEPERSLAALIYLSGNRVSEIVGIPHYESERKADMFSMWKLEPVRKEDFSYRDDQPIVRVHARTLKRRSKAKHQYVFRIDTYEEARYWNIVKTRLDQLQPQEYAWNVSRYKLWKALEKATKGLGGLHESKPRVKATGITPHKLRSLRATRDAVYFEMDALSLKDKFNWENPKMAFQYAKLNSKNIEDRLMRKQA